MWEQALSDLAMKGCSMEPRITLLTLGVDDLERSLADDVGLGPRVEGFAGFTIAHNVRTREEVDVLLDRARRAGAAIPGPAREMHWGGYVGFFADPDGHVWEIAWNPHFWVE
jgi:uncharacterized glyoxalase superfamily protein PhnB